jgi:hypothetical protein
MHCIYSGLLKGIDKLVKMRTLPQILGDMPYLDRPYHTALKD